MESTPDDILLIIFQIYVHQLRRPPVRLLYVNRRWNSLALNTPSLWTRIIIDLKSKPVTSMLSCGDKPDIIFGIRRQKISNGGHIGADLLGQYLARSVPKGSSSGLPLDIEIYSSVDGPFKRPNGLLNTALDLFGACKCPDRSSYQHLFHRAILTLAGSPSVGSQSSSLARQDMRRWRSLELELGEFSCPRHGQVQVSLDPLGLPGYTEFPLLESLILRKVDTWNDLISMPALINLEMYQSRLTTFPSMESLHSLLITSNAGSWMAGANDPPWTECINLHTLTIDLWDINKLSLFRSLPKLSTIIFNQPMKLNVMQALEVVFNDSRPLESLTLTEEWMRNVSFVFKMCPRLRVKLLRLKTPGEQEAISVDHDRLHVSSFITKDQLTSTFAVLEELGRRDIQIEPADAFMRAILRTARSESLRKQWLHSDVIPS